MGFAIEEFVHRRPFLFHLTTRENFSGVRRDRVLKSASELAPGRSELLESRRAEDSIIRVNGGPVMLRDQSPLHRNNMRLEGGWTFERFLREINGKVFFWAGTLNGPNPYGIRHYARYRSGAPIMIRTPTPHEAGSMRFCKYNSGSPRYSGGVAPPRGPSTFVRGEDASFRVCDVVEVVFDRFFPLPDGTEFAPRPSGPWQPF